jgi:hypothetical protein
MYSTGGGGTRKAVREGEAGGGEASDRAMDEAGETALPDAEDATLPDAKLGVRVRVLRRWVRGPMPDSELENQPSAIRAVMIPHEDVSSSSVEAAVVARHHAPRRRRQNSCLPVVRLSGCG